MYRVVMVWCCCALALSSCTKPEQGSDLPPLASASPSAVTPSPSASAGPVDAKAAIVALARAYYLESNEAIRTGSTTRLRALTVTSCPCHAFADHIDTDWREGKVDSPRFYTVVDVRSPLFRDPTRGVVTVFYRTDRYRVIGTSGNVIADVPADPKIKSSRVDMQIIHGVWKVTNVVRL